VTAPLLTAQAAAARDAADPLAGFGDRFESPRGADGQPLTYLVGNSLGLMPKRARLLLEEEMEDWGRFGVEGHLEARTPWYSYHEVFRDAAARLVGAAPADVVLMNSLTVNLHLMLVSFYRPHGDRTAVLMEEHAFPSDTYAVQTHLAARGVDPGGNLLVARARPGEDHLRTEDLLAMLAERGREIALVLLGGVNYYTGQLFDLPRIALAARQAGCMVGFDLAHAVGNVPLALGDWDVDFAVWCSYKYLNGGPGAVAGCYVNPRHGRDPSVPRFAGWWGNDPATRFEMRPDFVPRPGADGWQLSNPPIFSMTPLRAAFELFDEVGMPALRARSVALTGALEALLRALPGSPIRILTPSDPSARGCQLSLKVPGRGRWLHDALRREGIVTDYRDPDVVRMAPVPLYNTFADVVRTAEAVGRILAHG